MKSLLSLLTIGLLAMALHTTDADAQPAPENVLVMELKDGIVRIELLPELAPQHVERIQTLARQGFYDGIVFHRVLDGFMAQTGAPTGTGRGGYDLPDLPADCSPAPSAPGVVALAPQHVERIKTLARQGFYDGIVFHRVIDGFMAQTGDPTGTGRGGSDLPDLPAEFSAEPFERGVVGMARTQDPNSANSQFFITLAPARFLDRQYTVWGRVIEGMENVDAIKKAPPGDQSGTVRSEEHTSELQSLMRISSAVFCLKKKKERDLERPLEQTNTTPHQPHHRRD